MWNRRTISTGEGPRQDPFPLLIYTSGGILIGPSLADFVRAVAKLVIAIGLGVGFVILCCRSDFDPATLIQFAAGRLIGVIG